MRASTVFALVAALVPAALANPYFTAPVAGTKCQAGQPCIINWQDDNKAPTLAEFGDCSVGVYAGSTFTQTLMQTLAITNAQTAASVQFVPDPAMGANSTSYFIKMISLNTPDPTSSQYKATAYSAMFELTGMTGTFNSTVQQQIAGSAAPSSSAAATTPAAGASSSSTGTARAASSTTTASHNGTTTGTSNNAANGADSIAVAGMGMFGATVLAALAAVF